MSIRFTAAVTALALASGCAAQNRYEGRGLSPDVELIHAERQHASGVGLMIGGASCLAGSAGLAAAGSDSGLTTAAILAGATSLGMMIIGGQTIGKANDRIAVAEQAIADRNYEQEQAQLMKRAKVVKTRVAKARAEESAQQALEVERERLRLERERLALERARLEAAGVVVPSLSDEAEFTKAVERERAVEASDAQP